MSKASKAAKKSGVSVTPINEPNTPIVDEEVITSENDENAEDLNQDPVNTARENGDDDTDAPSTPPADDVPPVDPPTPPADKDDGTDAPPADKDDGTDAPPADKENKAEVKSKAKSKDDEVKALVAPSFFCNITSPSTDKGGLMTRSVQAIIELLAGDKYSSMKTDNKKLFKALTTEDEERNIVNIVSDTNVCGFLTETQIKRIKANVTLVERL